MAPKPKAAPRSGAQRKRQPLNANQEPVQRTRRSTRGHPGPDNDNDDEQDHENNPEPDNDNEDEDEDDDEDDEDKDDDDDVVDRPPNQVEKNAQGRVRGQGRGRGVKKGPPARYISYYNPNLCPLTPISQENCSRRRVR